MPKINVEVLGDSSSLVRAFARARTGAHRFERDMNKTGRGALAGSGALKGLGRSVAFASAGFLGGAGLGFALKSSVSAAVNFEKQMRLLQTQAGASGREVTVMSKALERLGPSVGFAPEELAKGLFHVESAGFRGAKALKVLKTAAEGAQVGGSDLEATTNALVAAQKSGIHGTESIKKSIGGLNAIVGAGNLRMEDLTGALGTGLLTAAAAVGLNLTDTGAALATLTRAGVPARAAATRLGLTFKLLSTQTPQAEAALRRLGITHNQLGDSLRRKGLIPTLELLQTKLRASGLSATEQSGILSKVFGGGRTSTTAITLLRQLDSLKQAQGSIASSGDKFGSAWAATQKTAAFATQRFRASLAVLQTTLGAALLPAITKATKALSDWLGKSRNQEAIQHRLHQAIKLVTVVVHGVVGAFRLANRITGSFKHTLIGLTAAYVAFKLVAGGSRISSNISATSGALKKLLAQTQRLLGFSRAFAGLARSEGIVGAASAAFPKATGRVKLFSGALGKAGLVGAAGAAAFGITTLILHLTGLDKKLKKAGASAFGLAAKLGLVHDPLAQFKDKKILGQSGTRKIRDEAARLEAGGLTPKEAAAKIAAQHPELATRDVEVLAGVFGIPPKIRAKIVKATAATVTKTKTAAAKATDKALATAVAATTARNAAAAAKKAAEKAQKAIVQGNQFFDARVDRSLSHAQDLAAPAQLAALGKIATQIRARIAGTKDITRKLGLEDKLLDVLRQRRDARKQASADRLAALTSREFRQLGLTGSGDEKTIGKKGLKRQLGTVEAAVKGTFLDTGKTRSMLSRIRRVLSEGLVPKDVRAKLREMLNGLTDELKNHGTKNQTAFRHVSSSALLSGLGLSPEAFRKAQQRIAQLGAGNTLPGQGSAAFAGAGATTIVHTTVHLDGKKVASNTTKHQRKANQRRSGSRRGPYAGH